MRPVLSALCAVLLLPAAPASAQPAAATITREADAALADAVDPQGSGAAVLIARGDRILYRRARGMAQIEFGVAMTPDQVSASPRSPRASPPRYSSRWRNAAKWHSTRR